MLSLQSASFKNTHKFYMYCKIMDIIVFLLFLAYCESAPMTTEEKDSSVTYLKRYGYLPEEYTNEDLYEAVVDFQNFAGMDMTGEMDDTMYEMTLVPRCGIADMFHHTREKRYSTYHRIWSKGKLTYNIRKYSEILTPAAVDRDVAAAFGLWSKYTKLTFEAKPQNTRTDLVVSFGKGNHGDESPFDGAGKVLAHAYFPRSGDIHFDDDEKWVEGKESGINFYHVAVHEIGHSLGLYHSDVQGAIMQPFYGGYKRQLYSRLPEDDIRGIQSLYGEKSKVEKRMKDVVKDAGETLCRTDKYDSIFVLGDIVYVFSRGRYFKIDLNRKKIDVGDISEMWKGVPNNAKAFTYNDKIFFLEGDRYWRFDGDKMDGSYPKSMKDGFAGIPANVNAAFVMQEKVVFFKGSQYWVFDPKKNPRVKPTYPKKMSSYFTGFPSKLDAVLVRDIDIVGFKDNKFYLYETSKRTVSTAPLNTNTFFGCT